MHLDHIDLILSIISCLSLYECMYIYSSAAVSTEVNINIFIISQFIVAGSLGIVSGETKTRGSVRSMACIT